MTIRNQDFEMFQGNTRIVEVSLSEGSLSNISSLQWVIKKFEDDAIPTISKELGQGIEINTPTLFTIYLDALDTKDTFGRYFHEAKVIDQEGNEISVCAGRITIYRTLIPPQDKED